MHIIQCIYIYIYICILIVCNIQLLQGGGSTRAVSRKPGCFGVSALSSGQFQSCMGMKPYLRINGYIYIHMIYIYIYVYMYMYTYNIRSRVQGYMYMNTYTVRLNRSIHGTGDRFGSSSSSLGHGHRIGHVARNFRCHPCSDIWRFMGL